MTNPQPRAAEELEAFRQEVRSVAGLGLKGKSAAIRNLKPSLDRLNNLGFSQEKLVEVMAECGLEMSLGYLKTALWRINNANREAE